MMAPVFGTSAAPVGPEQCIVGNGFLRDRTEQATAHVRPEPRLRLPSATTLTLALSGGIESACSKMLRVNARKSSSTTAVHARVVMARR